MHMMNKTIAACVASVTFAAVAGPAEAAGDRTVEVRVRQTTGGPQIHVDGKPVAPHMFWGRETVLRHPISEDWRHISIAYTPAVDVEKPLLKLEYQPRPGTLEIRNLSFGSCSKDFAKAESDGKQRSPCLAFRPERFPRGVTQTLSFDVRATGIEWVRPCVEQTEEGPYKYYAIQIPSDDPELLTLISQARKAHAAGVRFVTFETPRCWMPEGKENWEPIDRIFRELIAVSPDLLLLPRISMNAPAWWIALHPEARMVMEDGKESTYASVANRLYRREACAFAERIVRHLMEAFPRNFAGIHPAGQNSAEWFYLNSWTRLSGYDPATKEAFRAWLAAHGDPDAATAEVPPVEVRKPKAPASCLLDPKTEARVAAFNRYLQDDMCDFVADIVKTCRRASEGKKLVALFYGYGWEFSTMSHGPAACGHYALERLLDAAGDSIDFFSAPNSYNPDRGWLGSTPQMVAVETLMRRGILWVAEDDTRTYVNRDFIPLGAKQPFSGLDTREETCDVFRRNLAQQAVRGTGSWWMDLCGYGWQDDPELWKVLADFRSADVRTLARRAPYLPDVAHVLDEESMLYLAARSEVGGPLLGNARPAFARAGASYGQYILSDVLRDPPDAQLQFLPVWYADDAKAAALAALRGRQPAVTRVWCWAPACLGPEGISLARMERATGFAFRQLAKGGRQVASTPSGLAAGLPQTWGADGVKGDLDPRFAVLTRPGDEVWATWPDGQAALVLRPHSGGAGYEVFSGATELPQPLIAALVKKAGIRPAVDDPAKATIMRSGEFFSIQAMEAGEHVLNLPGSGRVLDALTGECLGNAPRVALTLRAGEVRLVEIKD